METCSIFGIWPLPGGNCAQWFSGTISAIAVMVALGGYGYSEWRHRRREKTEESEELAGIFILLCKVVAEVKMVNDLIEEPIKVKFGDDIIEVLPSLYGVKVERVAGLDKKQARVLVENDMQDLYHTIDLAITSLNQLNLGIEDYSGEINAFSTSNIEEKPEYSAKRLKRAAKFTQALRERFQKVVSRTIDACEGLNNIDPKKFRGNKRTKIEVDKIRSFIRE